MGARGRRGACLLRRLARPAQRGIEGRGTGAGIGAGRASAPRRAVRSRAPRRDRPPTPSPPPPQAQADAVNLLAGAKTQAHPENAVGVLTSAGVAPRVLVTPTPDLGKVLNAMQGVPVEGAANLAASVQVAQLALKHRANKHQRQRIVVFCGSPVSEDEAALVRIAKKLKKNNVAVDVVLFGGEGGADAEAKMEAFRAAADSGGNSHLVAVPAGAILADCLFGTPIFAGVDDDGFGGGGGGGGGGAAAGGGGGGGFEFGVDPSLDPELAMALRVSMEEERARQAAADAAAGGGGGSGDAAAAAPAPAAAADAGGAAPMDEDALLQQALAMSMAGRHGGGGGGGEAMDEGAEADEDAELARALALSVADAGGSSAPAAPSAPGDEAYVSSVVASLPGVDADDPAVRDAVRKAAAKKGGGGEGK